MRFTIHLHKYNSLVFRVEARYCFIERETELKTKEVIRIFLIGFGLLGHELKLQLENLKENRR